VSLEHGPAVGQSSALSYTQPATAASGGKFQASRSSPGCCRHPQSRFPAAETCGGALHGDHSGLPPAAAISRQLDTSPDEPDDVLTSESGQPTAADPAIARLPRATCWRFRAGHHRF